MERLLKVMEAVCERPGLYVPDCDMREVRAYLDGFAHAMSADELDGYPFGGFLRWLEIEHDICHSGWGWDRILVHAAGSHRAAIASLPERFAAYRRAVATGTFDPNTARERQFGSSFREPRSPVTRNYYQRGDRPSQATHPA